MEYSKITSVEVFNFMTYSHAVGYFDKQGIINIKGYNNSGKSTMLKAVAVCLMNMYPKAQAKFIRHGEKYFRVVVSFDDGVSLTRDKYLSGQSLYEMHKNGELLFTTKEGERLTKVDDVPQVIQDYLGLCMVSTGCLNYQIRQDPLWLVDTSGSENYVALNEILRTEQISRANAMLNSDTNKLNSEIALIEAGLQETKMALVDAQEYTEGLLKGLQRREKLCNKLLARYKRLQEICAMVGELSKIPDIPEIKGVSYARYDLIDGVSEKLKEYFGIVVPPEVKKISGVSRLTDIERVCGMVQEVPVKSIPEMSTVGTEKDEDLTKILGMLSEVLKFNSDIKSLGGELSDVEDRLSTIVAEAKAKGIRYVRCDNCGTYVEVSEDAGA